MRDMWRRRRGSSGTAPVLTPLTRATDREKPNSGLRRDHLRRLARGLGQCCHLSGYANQGVPALLQTESGPIQRESIHVMLRLVPARIMFAVEREFEFLFLRRQLHPRLE